MQLIRQLTIPCLAAALAIVVAACNRTEPPLTPEAARAKGDALLKQMSQHVAATQVFSYSTEQESDVVRTNGEKITQHFNRRTIVRRPNQIAFVDSGQDHDSASWFDGQYLTIVMNRDKVWVRGPMPPTLDEAMDYVSSEYAVQVPTADLLYSNPYEALITPDTTGGWVNVEQIGTQTCDHLSYQQAVVDWQIWLTQGERVLPCQLLITYKTAPGQPTTKVVFSDWNESPAVTDTTFVASVPEGYRRIKIMRHATVEDKTVATEKGDQQ